MKTYRKLLMGLLALTLCIALPSCSSDDDNDEPQSEAEVQGMVELFNLKLNLCLLDEDGEPIEAVFGEAYRESTPSERAYYTKNTATAKRRFQSLFNSTTQCSSDGNTYTLANNLGTATFAVGDGNKGLLGTATFNVPGLKGKVTKIYFIDFTQRGENSDMNLERFNKIKRGTIIRGGGPLPYSIAFTPYEEDDENYWIACAPRIEGYDDYYPSLPTSFERTYGYTMDEYFKQFTEEEYIKFYNALMTFLNSDRYTEGTDKQFNDYGDLYWHWDKKSLYICARFDIMHSTYSFVLLTPDNYANRTKLYTVQEGDPLPAELSKAYPVGTRYDLVNPYQALFIMEE